MPASARNCCFTLHDWTQSDLKEMEGKKWTSSYTIYGKEICPKTGRPHLQGYVEWRSSKEFTVMHKFFKGRGHWEARYKESTAEKAAEYCRKDKDFTEWGEISQQGKRTDIEETMELVRNGATELEVFEAMPAVAFKYPKALERYRLLVDKSKSKGFKKRDVRCYWGKTGTGKTRKAMEEFPDAFMVSMGVTGFWWTGYDGESCVVMDEFRGNIPLCQLLRMLDGYAVQVGVHGGSRYLNAETIIITSNVPIRDWYPNADAESMAALDRRFNCVLFFPGDPKKTAEVASNTRSPRTERKNLEENFLDCKL